MRMEQTGVAGLRRMVGRLVGRWGKAEAREDGEGKRGEMCGRMLYGVYYILLSYISILRIRTSFQTPIFASAHQPTDQPTYAIHSHGADIRLWEGC